MSEWEDTGSSKCPDCGVANDVHQWLGKCQPEREGVGFLVGRREAMSAPKVGEYGEPLSIDQPANRYGKNIYGRDTAGALVLVAREVEPYLAERMIATCNAMSGHNPEALAGLLDALNKAGEWVADVEPKLPMPGGGDTQQEVLDMIEAALAAFGEGR